MNTGLVNANDALRWAQEGDESSAWIVLGDFNRPIDDGDADPFGHQGTNGERDRGAQIRRHHGCAAQLANAAYGC